MVCGPRGRLWPARAGLVRETRGQRLGDSPIAQLGSWDQAQGARGTRCWGRMGRSAASHTEASVQPSRVTLLTPEFPSGLSGGGSALLVTVTGDQRAVKWLAASLTGPEGMLQTAGARALHTGCPESGNSRSLIVSDVLIHRRGKRNVLRIARLVKCLCRNHDQMG